MFLDAKFLRGTNYPVDAVLKNVEANAARELPVIGYKRAAIVGGGPSLQDYIEELRDYDGVIFAVNGTHDYLIERGIIPDYHVVMDARPGNVSFFTKPRKDVHYLIASQCAPEIFELLEGYTVSMWHAAGPEEVIDFLGKIKPGTQLVGGGETVSTRAMYLAYILGCMTLDLYGLDSSNRGDHKHSYKQPLNEGQPVYEFEVNGKTYSASGPMASQAETFILQAKKLQSLGVTINMRCDGLLPDMWSRQLEMDSGPIEIREKNKYTRMWRIDEYRESPGLELVDDFFEQMSPSGKVIDFGCGSGKSAKAFMDKGLSALGVDIAPNCLDKDVRIPLCLAPLWNLPEIKGDFGFCTDVMEHIPTDKVDDVLSSIRRCVDNCYFQISTVPDKFGQCIGETLHLTVKSPDWWEKKISRLWKDVSRRDKGSSCLFVCKTPVLNLRATTLGE